MNASGIVESRTTQRHSAAVPALSDIEAASLRRILNLSAQLPDDWSGMMGRSTLQEDFGAIRFQLAYMSYALALTHVHRLPAAPAVFRGPFDRLIAKMLSPDVWLYWHYVSTGNGPFNSALGELPARWDPVATDNIMYSAYVQSMALLYHYLFRDPKYAKEGALTFVIDPLFWGSGGKRFVYDEKSLNEHLYWSMVERGYLGIACEPNCVFQICNQVPIIGFRMHDLVYGGSLAAETTAGYLKAWEEFGVLNAAGHYNLMVQERERQVLTPEGMPWADFWMASLMHAWNPDFVERHYPQQLRRWLVDGPNDTAYITPSPTLSPRGASARDFGWAAVCASEVGDQVTLKRLLAYADAHLHPQWSEGALFYARCDEESDERGLPIAMDPHTSNALLTYARLNVPEGLRKLYEGPWHDNHFAEPALIEMTPSLDVRRAIFDAEVNALVLTVAPYGAVPVPARLEIANTGTRGAWVLERDGRQLAHGQHERVGECTECRVFVDAERLVIELDVRATSTLVLSWD